MTFSFRSNLVETVRTFTLGPLSTPLADPERELTRRTTIDGGYDPANYRTSAASFISVNPQECRFVLMGGKHDIGFLFPLKDAVDHMGLITRHAWKPDTHSFHLFDQYRRRPNLPTNVTLFEPNDRGLALSIEFEGVDYQEDNRHRGYHPIRTKEHVSTETPYGIQKIRRPLHLVYDHMIVGVQTYSIVV